MTLDEILAFCNFNSTPDKDLGDAKVVIRVNGEPKEIDFIWVQDVVKVHEKMFDVDESGIFNLGSGKAYSFDDIAKAFNKPIDHQKMPEKLRSQYQEFTLSNNNKLLERIGPYEFTDVIEFITSRNI